VVNVADESKVLYSVCSLDVSGGGKDVRSCNTSNMRKLNILRNSHNYKLKKKKQYISRSSDQLTVIESFTKT